MILITGGAYQGKRAYAQQNLKIDPIEIIDCGECDIDSILYAKCVCNFHLAVKRMLENKNDPIEFAKKIAEKNNDIVIITNEIGCGIIPLEKNDRIFREAVGRVCCLLSANAEKVIRVICGIPMTIKG